MDQIIEPSTLHIPNNTSQPLEVISC